MKKELSSMQNDMFFVAADNLAIQWKEKYQIRKDMIEMRNFVPEALLITCMIRERANAMGDEMALCEGEVSMADTIGSEIVGSMRLDSSLMQVRYSLDEEDDGDEEDWDEEDEDWDEDDEEDWDEDEEEWDEDEDWDEDDEEDDDEDWDEEEEKE
jgi:hypothetical protein